MSQGIRSWFRELCKGVAGNCWQNSVEGAALQHCAHDQVVHDRSCGKLQHCAHDHVIHGMGVRETDGRTLSKATCQKDQRLRETATKKLKSNFRRPGWTTITCQSQIVGTLRKSSRIFVEI